MKKTNWEKLDIISRIIISLTIACVGWYFTDTYQKEQHELNKTQLESEILKTAINGNDNEKKLAIKFASIIAKKFDDKEFEKIILEISYSEENTDTVRLKARKRFLELSLDDPNPIIREISQKNFNIISLKDALIPADNYFKVEHFSKSAMGYEEATSLVPLGTNIDLSILEKARNNLVENPEKACLLYRKFFAQFR